MNSQAKRENVQLIVLDSVLFGTAKALEYLDLEGQVMMDKIGEGILEYCFKKGFIEKSGDPQQLVNKVGSFFAENGYIGGAQIGQEGELVAVTLMDWRYLGLMKRLRKEEHYLLACPLCLANNAVFRSNGLYGQVVYEELTPDGGFLRKYKMIPATTVSPPESLTPPKLTNLNPVKYDGTVKVGAPAVEAVMYGLARGFEYLGAQAQVLLDRVGHGIIEFLQAEAQLTLTGNLTKDLDLLSSFFKSRGLADEIQFTVSSSKATTGFRNYRYEPVLRTLLEEDLRLTSCPFTLTERALLREVGWAVGESDWTLLGDKGAQLNMRLTKIVNQEFDEDRIGALMDKV
jgi:hypothetical protein